jgi:hypothetical protein
MGNFVLENNIINALNNLSQNNISLGNIIEYIDYHQKIKYTKDEVVSFIKNIGYDKLNYENIFNIIVILLDNYYENLCEKRFKNEGDDFNENMNIKNTIKELIISANNDKNLLGNKKEDITKKLLIILAENTGCVEDTKIAENILNELYDKYNIITKSDIDDFYKNAAIGRWL